MPAGLSASAALTAIAELAQDLACSANLDASLSAVVQKIADTMRAEAASLFLLSADGTALVCRFSVGPVQFVGQRVVPGQGVIGRAMQTGVCQLVATPVRIAISTTASTPKAAFRPALCCVLRWLRRTAQSVPWKY